MSFLFFVFLFCCRTISETLFYSPDVFKKLEAVKKLSLVFSFRDSLTYFDHNVKFFATNIVYQPVSVGSEIVKDIVV